MPTFRRSDQLGWRWGLLVPVLGCCVAPGDGGWGRANRGGGGGPDSAWGMLLSDGPGVALPVVCRVGALDARSRPPRPCCRWPSAGMRVCVIENSADSVVGSAL